MKRRDVFWGLLFIVAAVLIIVNQFGFFTGISMFDIVLTVILAGIIIKSIMYINFWGILFPLAFLCIIYAKQLDITSFTPWPVLLTALLFSIGLSLIFQKHCWSHHCFHHNHTCSSTRSEENDNTVNCYANFGECIKYVNSESFERADIKCSFGTVKAYFDNAQIPSGNADINLDVSFGDCQLYIPRTWKIVNDANVFLGDINENGRTVDSASPIVTLHGNVSFGDAKIIYV